MTHITTYSRNYDSFDGLINTSDRHLDTIENTSLRQLHPKPEDRSPYFSLNTAPAKAAFGSSAAYLSGLGQDLTQYRSRNVYTLEKGIQAPHTNRWALGRGLIITVALLGLFSAVNITDNGQSGPVQPVANPVISSPNDNEVMAMLASNPETMSATGGWAKPSNTKQTASSNWKSSGNTSTTANNTPASSAATDASDSSPTTSNQPQTGGRGGNEESSTPIIDTPPITVTPPTTEQPDTTVVVDPTPTTEDEPIVEITLPPLLGGGESNENTEETQPETDSDPTLIEIDTPIINIGL